MNDLPERDGLRVGDVAVVTGGAQGIGRAVARRLARDGARLAVWDALDDGGEETVEMCRSEGAEATFFHADVGDADQVSAATHATVKRFGAPFALINNAGIYPRTPFLEMDLAEWNQVLRVNLTGHFLCAQSIARHMVTAGRGAMVKSSSGRALEGAVRGCHYAATKAAIVNLTKTLALELAPHGIRVNCILPGVAETAQPLADTTLEELRARGSVIPLGRIGQPDDVAAAISFLVGPDSGYMTGQLVAANGGAIMVP